MIDRMAVIPTREQARWMLERLTLIREFEERLKWLVENGVPVGAVHLYIGQEAVAVGTCAALRGDDWIASTHRGHGHCIAKGVEVRAMMAELYGKATGTNRGKGGSMHVTDITKGVLGVNPIVGAGAAHAIGAGLSAKVRKTDQVCAAFFGEGAAGIGTLHEAMNMAAIWKLGVVFVCENNGYAQATPVEYALSIPNVADRAASYNMPGEVVDGQDVVAVYDAVQRAVAHARSGAGPSLIECKTYRYYGHHQGDDPLRYRTKDEERAARERDCVQRFRQYVQAHALLTASEIEDVDAGVKALLDDAVEFAEKSPVPEASELHSHVYVEPSRL
jgi:pyruvate dehydrogenase E1 component alpha subunit